MTRPIGLDATRRYPIALPDGTPITNTVHLSVAISHPRFTAGDYSYFSHFHMPEDPLSVLAPYLFPFSKERLTIGKFCQFAHATTFITSSANHPMGGFSTYPFRVFNPETMAGYIDLPAKDTVVGNDVWIGYGAIIMPGVTIGDGAIIATGAVVTKDVPPYAIAGGNPAQVVRQRFSDAVIADLLAIRWWDWPVETIEANLSLIEGADIEGLKSAHQVV